MYADHFPYSILLQTRHFNACCYYNDVMCVHWDLLYEAGLQVRDCEKMFCHWLSLYTPTSGAGTRLCLLRFVGQFSSQWQWGFPSCHRLQPASCFHPGYSIVCSLSHCYHNVLQHQERPTLNMERIRNNIYNLEQTINQTMKWRSLKRTSACCVLSDSSSSSCCCCDKTGGAELFFQRNISCRTSLIAQVCRGHGLSSVSCEYSSKN